MCQRNGLRSVMRRFARRAGRSEAEAVRQLRRGPRRASRRRPGPRGSARPMSMVAILARADHRRDRQAGRGGVRDARRRPPSARFSAEVIISTQSEEGLRPPVPPCATTSAGRCWRVSASRVGEGHADDRAGREARSEVGIAFAVCRAVPLGEGREGVLDRFGAGHDHPPLLDPVGDEVALLEARAPCAPRPGSSSGPCW